MNNARERGPYSALSHQEENHAPMMAILGGVFALMLVFLLVVNLFASDAARGRRDQMVEHGVHRIEAGDGTSGYLVIVFPDSLRIVETDTSMPPRAICKPRGAFVNYAQQVYGVKDDQLVFIVLEGSTGTMRAARDCLRRLSMWEDEKLKIGRVIADDEFRKSVSLDEIPPYISESAEDPQ